MHRLLINFSHSITNTGLLNASLTSAVFNDSIPALQLLHDTIGTASTVSNAFGTLMQGVHLPV